MSIVIKDDYKSIIKDTEAIASKFVSIQKNLGKVKTQLNSAYTGGKDFNTWISESEKSVKKLSENTSKLSKAMDTALTTIISKDEAASPTFKNAFGDLINSKKTVEGLLSDFVSSAWARAMAVVVGTKVINDNVVDNSGENEDDAIWTVDTSSESSTAINEKAISPDKLDELYNQGYKVDKSGYADKIYGFNKSGGCTWYAASRYEEINGTGTLKGVSGNGGDWYKTVNKDNFNVTATSKNDYSYIVSNSLATRQRSGGVRDDNHVVYIEGETTDSNGKQYVYFTQDGPSGTYYRNKGLDGKIEKWTIEKFADYYDYIITAK